MRFVAINIPAACPLSGAGGAGGLWAGGGGGGGCGDPPALVHVDQSVEHPCARCQERPRRRRGRYCPRCHALDMRDRRRKARRELLKAGLAKRRGRKDGQL